MIFVELLQVGFHLLRAFVDSAGSLERIVAPTNLRMHPLQQGARMGH
jgi:hypothetical protein